MNIEGVFLVLLCFAIGIGAFYTNNKGRHSLSMLLLLLLGFLLRAYTASDFYLHCWDERCHALVAKNLMQQPLHPYLYREALLPYDYTNWSANHVWLHKQPLSLWMMAASMKLFGVHVYSLRLPSVLSSTISIWLVYLIGKYFFNQRVAFLAAFFFAVNGLVIEIAGARVATDHPDTLFLFFILLAVFFTVLFCAQEKYKFNIGVGISLGAALLTKWLPALIVVPIWLLLVADTHKFSKKQIALQLFVLLSVAMIIFLPWQFYIQAHFPQEAAWERHYNTRHFFEALEGHGAEWYYYLNRIRIDYGELIYLPLIWILYQFATHRKDFKLWAIILWFAAPIIFFSIAATKMNGYIMIAAPALFIVSAAFYYYLKDVKVNSKIKWLKQTILLLMIGLSVRYCIERVKPFEPTDVNYNWVFDLEKWNQKNNSKAVLFGYHAPLEAMFYTHAIVYEQVPSANTIVEIQQLDYEVFIQESASISPKIRALKGVRFIQLK
ncbi:MAG: glycosyltransferase family 39 protein [Phycisphaerales bacterium]|nr:glycosyltransferase family 39 protein [Phycisphaerales bacterium]